MNSARDLGRTLCRVRRGSIKVATKKSVTTLGDRSPSRAHLTGRGPQDQAARSPGTWTLHPADLPTRLPAALAVKRPHGRRMTSASRARGTGRLPQPASRTPFPRGFPDADAGGSGPGTCASSLTRCRRRVGWGAGAVCRTEATDRRPGCRVRTRTQGARSHDWHGIRESRLF